MEEQAYLTSIFAAAFYLVVSVRLLGLYRRTRERPELLLGIYFGFSGAYYIAYNAPSLLGFDPWASTAEWAIEWVYILGVFPYMFFIRSVFRPKDGWAGVLVGTCAMLLLAGTAVGTLDGQRTYSLDNQWFLVQWVGYTVPCVWMTWEPLLARRGARKRVRVGLCAPIVANRYLLFACFGGFQSLACLADLFYAAEISASQTVSQFSDALLGGSEIASVAVLSLAFFPPAVYSDWIERRAVVLATQTDGSRDG